MSAAARQEVGDGFDIRTLAVTYSDGFVIDGHDHPWGQLIYGVSGVMRVVSDGVAWFVPSTRAIWLPAGRPHEITMKGRVAMRTLYISPGRARPLPDRAVALEVVPVLRELILHALTVEMLDRTLPAHDRLAGVIVDLIAQARPTDFSLPLPRDVRALAFTEMVQAAPGERADLAALAGRAGASLRTLQRLIADETGLSLEAWRQKARLVHGAAALTGGASVTVAALDCGYDSISAFIAAFRKQFGVTPGRYRAPGPGA